MILVTIPISSLNYVRIPQNSGRYKFGTLQILLYSTRRGGVRDTEDDPKSPTIKGSLINQDAHLSIK